MESLKNKYNFSDKQTEEIIKLKKWLEENNDSLNRNCIVSDVRYFKYDTDNFYCSYYKDGWGTGERTCGWIYFGIDKEGKVSRYERNFPKERLIIDKFDEFEKIEFMKNDITKTDSEEGNTKSSMHSKITGDFGESLLLYFLSKSYFEPALVDHSGIDIIAYNKTDKSRIGVSVKSRSRTLQRPNDGLLVPGDNYQKIIESCNFYASDPFICFVFDVPASETIGTIHLFLMSITTLLTYYPNFKDGKDFTFSMKSNLNKYLTDKNISRLIFDYNSENWN